MKRAPLTALLTVVLLAAAVVIPAARQNPKSDAGKATVVVLDEQNWDEFAPAGKEVDAIYGDIVLRNDHLVAVIAQPLPTRNANMTVREVGGALIDFTTRQDQSDQLSAFYPGRRNYKYSKFTTTATSDKPLRESGGFVPNVPQRGDTVSVVMEAPATESKPEVLTVYELAAGSRDLKVVTMYKNSSAAPLTFELEDDLRLDGGKEDLIRSPNGEHRSFWAYDRHWNQAYGLLLKSNPMLAGTMLINSDARLSTFSYKSMEGKTEKTLAPGESFTITRWLWPAENLLDLRAMQDPGDGTVASRAALMISDAAGQPLRRALVEFYTESGDFYASGRTTVEGTLDTHVPRGKYAVRVSAFGNRVDQYQLQIDVANDGKFDLKVPGFKTGLLEAAFTDADGQPLPCKVMFTPLDGNPWKVDLGPESAEFAVKNLYYTPNGKFTQELPAGNYQIDVSHGPEFNIARLATAVGPGKTQTVAAKLERVVDTAGWVSSDFHSHSSPSGDNTGSQLGRVLNLVAEHIEFAPCTEHNRVDTYVPHIERLGVQDFIATVSGMELTGQPLPLNHQNAFPLRRTPHTQDNGGPLVADNLEEQIERLALWDDRSDKLVQVNHPDTGWMFYDKNGDGVPDNGFERAFPFMDVMEIHPVDNALQLVPVREFPGGNKYHNNVFRWLQLLNQGFRIYGVVNTDAHYNYHGSGGLRNWIQSSTDDPAKIDPMEMVHAAQEGRLVMSNGPFLEVWASEPGQAKKVTCGQDLAAPGKQVSLKVKVQTPSWLDINRVFVLVNGRIDPKHDYSREKTPDVFRAGVVKFDETLEVALARDAHLIVVAGNVGGRFPTAVMPGPWQPAALTNPIFVDLDGDGFQANKDTLDHPLPVKFGTTK